MSEFLVVCGDVGGKYNYVEFCSKIKCSLELTWKKLGFFCCKCKQLHLRNLELWVSQVVDTIQTMVNSLELLDKSPSDSTVTHTG